MMELKRIGVFSAAKLVGTVDALLGLIFGGLISLASLLGMAADQASGNGGDAIFGLIFGAGAVVIMPIFYGIAGFVFTAIFVACYNLLARMVGGIEIDLVPKPEP